MIFNKKKKEVKENEVKKEFNPQFNIKSSTLQATPSGEGLTVEDIKKIIAEWLNPDHVLYKTRYTKRQVRAVTKLQSVANDFFIEIDEETGDIVYEGCLARLLENFRVAKLSEEGLTSKELVDILRERLTNWGEETTGEKIGRFLD